MYRTVHIRIPDDTLDIKVTLTIGVHFDSVELDIRSKDKGTAWTDSNYIGLTAKGLSWHGAKGFADYATSIIGVDITTPVMACK